MHIFYCTGEKFGEVARVFLTKKHSPDAGVGSTGRWPRASGVRSVGGSGVQNAPDAGTERSAVTV